MKMDENELVYARSEMAQLHIWMQFVPTINFRVADGALDTKMSDELRIWISS